MGLNEKNNVKKINICSHFVMRNAVTHVGMSPEFF